jgi:SOUL heme-binding protein
MTTMAGAIRNWIVGRNWLAGCVLALLAVVGARVGLQGAEAEAEGFMITHSPEHLAGLACLKQVLDDKSATPNAMLTALAEAARLVPDNVLVQRRAKGAKALSDVAAIRKSAVETKTILEFQPMAESPLPEGFPGPTPVGTIQVQTYPVYRSAVANTPNVDGAFWTLFSHIQKESIAMTTPVEMQVASEGDVPVKPGMAAMREMAFLYRSTQQGTLGADGKVLVADRPALQAASIGLTGDATELVVKTAVADIRDWLARQTTPGGQLIYTEAGSPRVMGYNSPFVPYAKRYFEVQIPVNAK